MSILLTRCNFNLLKPMIFFHPGNFCLFLSVKFTQEGAAAAAAATAAATHSCTRQPTSDVTAGHSP